MDRRRRGGAPRFEPGAPRSDQADGWRGSPQCQVAPGCTLECATPGSTSGLGFLTLSITTVDLRVPGGPTPGRDLTWNGAGRRPRSHVSGGAPPLFVADAAGNRGDHAAPSRRASISGAATDLSRPLTRVRIRWHGVSRETAPHRECPPLTAPAKFCAAALDDTALRCPRTWRTGADGGIAVGGGQPTSTGTRVTGTTAFPHRGDVSRGTPAVRAFSAASGHRDRRRGAPSGHIDTGPGTDARAGIVAMVVVALHGQVLPGGQGSRSVAGDPPPSIEADASRSRRPWGGAGSGHGEQGTGRSAVLARGEVSTEVRAIGVLV